ncbi:MAG TPA: PqiC family protein [Candidatus Binataceae bacterium]|nr:PqiC family protein [Candidatus Binataceae bacterium]
MNTARPYLLLLSLSLFAPLVAACSSLLAPVPDRTSYYILTPIAASATSPSTGSELTIGLGEIHLPAYLDRREMVTRIDANRLKIADNDLWAEPLSAAVRSVLNENLAQLLGPVRIVNYPWYSSTHVDYAVTLNATNFQCDTGRQCRVDAQWSISNQAGQMVCQGHSAITLTADSDSASAQAAALSQALGQMSRQIADSVSQASQAHAAAH